MYSGDIGYWGIGKVAPKFDNDKGVSLVHSGGNEAD